MMVSVRPSSTTAAAAATTLMARMTNGSCQEKAAGEREKEKEKERERKKERERERKGESQFQFEDHLRLLHFSRVAKSHTFYHKRRLGFATWWIMF
jgi:hypothetical protein